MASPGDTEPDIPDWDSYYDGAPNGDFARLIPFSPAARNSFSQLIGRLGAEPTCLPHIREFIHYDETVVITEDSATDDVESQSEPIQAFCGYYKLNMSIPPKRLKMGWVLGSRRPDRPDDVDFVLTHAPRQHGVRGRHCRLVRNLQTGLLMVVSDGHKVLVNGNRTLERKGTSQCPKQYQIALHQRSSITVGDLTYSLIFTKLSQTQQEQELREARANFVDSASPGPTAAMFLSPTPLKQTTDYHGYVLYNPTTGGATSVVSLGYLESTGELVIIKKMKQTKNNNENVKSEIAMLRLLNHDNICKLKDVIDLSEGRHPSRYRDNELAEVSLALYPPAATVASDIIRIWQTRVGYQTCETFLQTTISQVASGLAYMHSKNIMHRDIKPDNLAYVTLDPVYIIIIDLGSSERKSFSTDHYRGTVRYLAPEVMSVKNKTSAESFSFPVDLWSVGLTLLEFLLSQRQNTNFGDVSLRPWLAELLNERPGQEFPSLWNLARRLLDWDASKRLTAAEVVEYLPPRELPPNPPPKPSQDAPSKRQKVEE